MAVNRPHRIQPGSPLSDHYTVVGLVRLSEGRMFYRANDMRPDRPQKFCWNCGYDGTPRHQNYCDECSQEMTTRNFLVSCRWDAGANRFAAFFDREIEHPVLCTPIDLFRERGSLCSVIDWNKEDFLLNHSAPLPVSQVLKLGTNMCGLIAYLYEQGITLDEMFIGNFLVRSQNNDILFFDPNVRSLYDGPVPESQRGREIANLALVLQRFLSVEHKELHDLLQETIKGGFSSTYEFGRALEHFVIEEPQDASLVDLAGVSDVGLIRSLNEDNWGWRKINEKTSLYVVADGMGGHDAGEVASQLAVEGICYKLEELLMSGTTVSREELQEQLYYAFQYANNNIKSTSEEMGSDMGTTMVCAMIIDNRIGLIANVGDSRAYLLREQQLHRISKDHSYVEKMVEDGQLTLEEARVHPKSNILLRTVGTERDIKIDIFPIQLQSRDVILLCSDGLWGEIPEDILESVINENMDLRKTAQLLVRESHLGGGKDNCTLIMIRMP